MIGFMCAALLISGLFPATNTHGAPARYGPPASYIVVLKENMNVLATVRALEVQFGFAHSLLYEDAIAGFSAALPSRLALRLGRDPRVEFLSADRLTRINAERVPIPVGETVPSGVRRIAAATSSYAPEASDFAVAVLDTGIDFRHPDLNAVDAHSCVGRTRTALDDNGHGTHVAGIIAARNTGNGVIGVSPGTTLYAVKVLDAAGNGSLSQLVCGVDWVSRHAARLGIRVANISLGAPGGSDGTCGQKLKDPLHAAICRLVARGVTVVAAAGNAGASLAGQVPAAYPEVLAVTAMTDADGEAGGLATPACTSRETDDTAASFSNYAAVEPDLSHTIAAPGVCILSAVLGGGYGIDSGTSMSAAHVAGVVMLCLGSMSAPGPCGGLTPQDTIRRLRGDAAAQPVGYGFVGDPSTGGADRYYGHLAFAGAY